MVFEWWIVREAVGRLANPPEVQGTMVLVIASVGLLINLMIMRWLHGSHDLNTRAAYWHVLGDALGSVAAMVSGLVILLTGWMPIDPILSFFVAAVLVWGGWCTPYSCLETAQCQACSFSTYRSRSYGGLATNT